MLVTQCLRRMDCVLLLLAFAGASLQLTQRANADAQESARTDDEKNGIVWKLRSIPPQVQDVQ